METNNVKQSFDTAERVFNELTTQDRLLCHEDMVAACELLFNATGWTFDELHAELVRRLHAY